MNTNINTAYGIPHTRYAHIDVDAFFASVLVRKDPRLRGKPLLALGMGGGCVIAASYEAKARGVKTGMRLVEARALCPGAIERLSDFTEACVASEQIEDLLRRECPVVEKMSVDEWLLDLRMLPGGTPEDVGGWALGMQETITNNVGLTVSLGIAPSKTLAKMASEYRKPAGITVLAPTPYPHPGTEEERKESMNCMDFLRSRSAAAVPGIGHRRLIHAEKHGWTTAWDFANADPETVVHLFGRPGRELQQELLGTPVYRVEEDDRPPQSVSRCRSFRPTANGSIVYAQLLEHLTVTVLKMRRARLAARRVSVWLRDGEYESTEDHCPLPRPMDTEEEILPFARRCFDSGWRSHTRVTQIGLGLFDLVPSGFAQYSLLEPTERLDGKKRIQSALDEIHRRFGRRAVVRGAAAVLPRKHKRKTPDLYGDPVDVM